MTKMIPAKTKEQFQIIEDLAKIIWTEHYTPIIGKQQVRYMLNKFQSVASIEQQIESNVTYQIVLDNDIPVGYFSYYIKEEALFLSKLYVLSSSRGKGIGKSALSFLETETIKLGLKKIQLTVNKYNSNSINAYQKMGFVTIKDIVQDIGAGYVMDDFVMEKIIH